MQTLIIGHKNPDMDAICSAIAYAEFKKASGHDHVLAGRCGHTNERIEYGLKRFGFSSPEFFNDVRPRVQDVMEQNVVCAMRNEPVYEAFARIGEKKFRGLPVIDEDNHCLGLISSFKITRHLFPPRELVERSREVHASLESIRKTIGAEYLAGAVDNTIRNHVLVVVAMQTDSFGKRLGALELDRTILVVGDRRNIQRMAIKAGVRAIVVSGGMGMDKELLALAKEHGTIVMDSPHDTATTILLARSAVYAGDMIYDDFLAIGPEVTLEEARQEIGMSPQFAFPVLNDDRVLVGILSKSDFLKPIPRQLILVDHNELSQAVSGASNLPIVEILDHHRIGAAPTQQPILFLNRPVGSTCSIVADCYEREGIPIPPPVAGILMCGLLSDTLNLTSPTTTETDRKLMERLSQISGVNPTDLAADIFSVGSPLLTMTSEQAVIADCKEYEERGKRFSVSQIEELTFAHFGEKKDELLESLGTLLSKRDLIFAALLVTDVNTQNSFLLVKGSDAFLRLIDFPETEPCIWRLDGIVSRKKQLLPYLTGLLAKLP